MRMNPPTFSLNYIILKFSELFLSFLIYVCKGRPSFLLSLSYSDVKQHDSVFKGWETWFSHFFYFQEKYFFPPLFSLKVEPSIPPQCLKGSICEIEKWIMLSFCWWAHWKRQMETLSPKENLQPLLHVRSADSKSSEKKKTLSWWLLSTLQLYRRSSENGLLIITLWTFSERWKSHLKPTEIRNFPGIRDCSLPKSFLAFRQCFTCCTMKSWLIVDRW